MKIIQKIVKPISKSCSTPVLAKNFSMCMEKMCVPLCEEKLY
ncbi:hypothetical protein MODO_2479 [Myroides odoratimimus]|uniref:Uncharacterized protein n=2 Tax=Myroides odoratimimus TaxID=76832 RepID=A0ABN0MNB9_9FLAO|nr:hypothetical protein [Myroides odoratimimus]AJH13852.1 hypothetical protein MPR_0652 [Myroides profundi]EHO14327.1 hypothetical protein HMPREF9715_00764 [Myroides odoratimimus CIP 101113]EKB03716.1 hypothetical protein HMPREF9711_02321 [Myroides odoratimimus CCUG 3837]EPH09503.1 hypothetical protein HMPREF9713_02840 [Myroides odoratimimus CCUG 12700]EPC08727.1 hypothetical protein HMPREF9712_03566 [Myroides odoratimimus CCUG 10230]